MEEKKIERKKERENTKVEYMKVYEHVALFKQTVITCARIERVKKRTNKIQLIEKYYSL